MDLFIIQGKLTQNTYSFKYYKFENVTTGQTYTVSGLTITPSELNTVIRSSFNQAYIVTTLPNFNNAKDKLDDYFNDLVSKLVDVYNNGYAFIITEDLNGI